MLFLQNLGTIFANGFISLWLWLIHSGMIGVGVLCAIYLGRIEYINKTQDAAPTRRML